MTEKKWTYDACKEAASKFSTLKEFRGAFPSAYKEAKRNDWIKDYYWLSARKHGYWSYETCYELAKSCKTKSEMKQASNWAYTMARKNGWIEDYTWLIVKDKKPKNYWSSFEHCKKEAEKYSSRQEMRNNNQSIYNACLKNGWLNEFFGDWAKKTDNYWSNLENVLNAAKECVGARDMLNKYGGAYNSAKKHGWVKLLVYKDKG